MSDAHLTDHEWKTKAAGEGRAFYLPGKSAAEIAAAGSQPDLETLTLTVPLRQAEALETAIVDLPELVAQAASALDTLAASISVGNFDARDVQPMLALFARALNTAEAKEVSALEAFDPVLRAALSDFRCAQREQAPKGRKGR